MPDLPDSLVQALDIGQLVPEQYAPYRPLMAEAFDFFLDRLSPRRQAALLADQLDLPPDASPAVRIVSVMRQCPTLHKLGQVIARDRRLAPDVRRQLQTLESLPPAIPTPEILDVIQRELGGSEGVTVGPRTLAEASVAVVVPFAWREGDGSSRQEGVFKVLKPGVEARLGEELEIWGALAEFLAERARAYDLPLLECRETLDQVRDLLLSEIRLDVEQAHLAEAAEFYAGNRLVLIPRLFPFSTARMTAMERVDGRKVTEVGDEERRRLADLIVEALVAMPFWGEAATVMFHADPHAGNLLCTADRRLAILDWSLAGRLTKPGREQLVQILLGALTLDAARVCGAASALSTRPPDSAALRSVVAGALAELRHGAVLGFDWLLGLLDRLATSGAVGFPADLLFFRKALLSLSGVVMDVAGQDALDRGLVCAGLAQFFRELPSRAAAAAHSRSFGTHVSNTDLFELWTSWPLTAARLWVGVCQDSLEAIGQGPRLQRVVPA
ncbi:MAG TPA: AarF/UbiB family protein, partial [Candidatus Sulfotelmatobacter sp.]|nr:AarF/UbiB family protein [Candidatus Sulfotelmatobacter sp.]